MSKKFRIIAGYTNYCELVIEAETIEQANQIALSTDGGDFSPYYAGSDWAIKDIIECSETR
jgi:hypothetical protein